MIELTKENFNDEVLQSKVPVLVDFYATWCFPCQKQGPILEEFGKAHPEIKLARLDVDGATELAITYGVMSIPALILFQNGEVAKQTVGLTMQDELEKLFL